MLFAHLLACGTPVPTEAPAPPERSEVNRRAAQQAIPLFWVDDTRTPGVLDPDEAVWLWQGGEPVPPPVADVLREPPPADGRQRALLAELDAGRPTLVLTEVAPAERGFVEAMLQVANALEHLHALQRGSAGVEPADDGPSLAVFHRNQGPRCEATTDPACRASAGPLPDVGVYPPGVLEKPDACTWLEAQDGLMSPFTAVRGSGDALTAVPYGQAWPEAAARAARVLELAAGHLPDDEAPLAAYLRVAAESFTTDDWVAADRAWLATRGKSAWYVRVGPDETYWEPCDRKAGYHLVFARMNPASARWEATLEPQKGAMERALAAKSGPYVARDVAFSLPEFIDIVVNAGDSRSALGATIGQSLPNWGPVAEAGGRTVAMTNLNIDPDSLRTQEERAAALFCDVGPYTSDPEPLLFSTLLHEAAHNLGPASGYTVDGKTDEQAFGGELATMLEELKAQTAALYLTDWLAEKGVITPELAQHAHLADLLWSLGKIADGMTDAEGGALAYPQLSAIQVGVLLESGALAWKPEQRAANGSDRGCLAVDLAALPHAIEGLADTVLAIKGGADVEAARALKRRHVDGRDAALHATIAERWRRAPQNAFVYGFRWL